MAVSEIKTREDLINELISWGRQYAPELNWVPKSIQGDLMVGMHSEVVYTLLLIVQYIRLTSRLNGFEDLLLDSSFQEKLAQALGITTSDLDDLIKYDLDGLATLYGLTPREGAAAQGIVRFYFSDTSVQDIPVGTMVWTSPPNSKRYVVTSTVSSITPTTTTETTPLSTRYGINPGLPFIDVLVEAEAVGEDYNVAAGSIHFTDYVPTSGTLVSLYNPYDFVSGRNEESNLEFVQRLIEDRYTLIPGTPAWIRSRVLSQFSQVKDVVVTTKASLGSSFPRDWGADVWIITSDVYTSVNETIPTNYGRYSPQYKPVVNMMTSNATLVQATMSTSPQYAHSSQAPDRVDFPILPNPGGVLYEYDPLVAQVQAYLDDEDYWMYGPPSSLLVRKGVKVPVKITVSSLSVLPGYSLASVKNDIRNTLRTNFLAYKLGVKLDASDVLNWILDVDGVDSVDTSAFRVTRTDTSEGTTNYLQPEYYEYFRYDSVEFV